MLAASQCRNRAPQTYLANTISEVAGILNPNLGDIATVVVEGAHEVWRLMEDDTDADGFDVIQSNACNYKWVRAGSVVNVRIFGATGNGETDDTEYFEDAIAAMQEKAILYIPTGRYLLAGLQINKDITIIAEPSATLLMGSDATAPMIEYTVAQTGGFYGGVVDGQKSLQTLTVWKPVIKTRTTTHFIINGVKFQNHTLAAVQDQASTGLLEICHCEFRNGAEHGGTTTTQAAMALYLASVGMQISVHHNKFIQDNVPSEPGRGSGGLLIAGSTSTNVSDNYFKRVGLTFNLNHVAVIHCYELNDDIIITNNIIEEPMWRAIVVQNSYRCNVSDNIIQGTGVNSLCASGVWINPTQREQTEGPNGAIVTGNTVFDLENAIGIFVYAAVANTSRVIVSNNDVKECLDGIRVSGVYETGIFYYEPIIVEGNVVNISGGDYGLRIENIRGQVIISHNDVRVTGTAHAFWAVTGLNEADVDLDGNYFSCDTVGFYGATMRGIRRLRVHSGTFLNTGVGATAVTIDQDSDGNDIQELMYQFDQISVPAGLVNITLADIVTWVRQTISGNSDPNNNYQAPIGAFYRRTTGGAGTTFYVKEGALINQWVAK